MKPGAILLLAAACQAQVPFKLDVERAVLSNHQRLQATIKVKIDGAELARRRGDGDLQIKIDVRDQQGHNYSAGGTIDLREANREMRHANVFYSHDVLVTPGNYHVSVQVIDTVSGQQGSAQRDFHVDPLAGDPFPGMWRDLPAVEFWPGGDGPDRWFAPMLTGRLHLTLDTQRPVRIDLLVNTTPSERGAPERHHGENMNALIPAMKTIFQTEVRNGSLNVALLDLSRQRTIFRQNNRLKMDWPQLRKSLQAGDPNKIDLQSLANRYSEGDFFVSSVRGLVESAPPTAEWMQVIIVLSGPMSFREGVQLHPIEIKGNGNCKVFYIRYAFHQPPFEPLSASGPDGMPRPERPVRVQLDELEATLAPLSPRVYDVESPLAFRKALASIFAEISH